MITQNTETGIKHMFYNRDQEMEVIRATQKCQRNYDRLKRVHPEDIDYLLWIAQNAPSKQYEAYYDVYYACRPAVIEDLSHYTWGCTHSRNPPSTWQNSQMNASLYILFVAKEPETQLNCHADGSLKSNKDPARWENAYVSIGIAMGLVMRAAVAEGFVCGANKSHGDMNGDKYWEKRLGILDDVEAGIKKITYGIGIGYPLEDKPRWYSDQKFLAIGSGNGSNLATDLDMKLNENGKPYRYVKIVDIDKHAGEEIEDHYGNKHIIPSEANIKINTMRNRVINAIEIK